MKEEAVMAAAERLIRDAEAQARLIDSDGETVVRTSDAQLVATYALAAAEQTARLEAEAERLRILLTRTFRNEHGVTYHECRICRSITVQGAEMKHYRNCSLTKAALTDLS